MQEQPVPGPPPQLALDPAHHGEGGGASFLPFARILATMLDGVLVARRDGRVVIANDAAGRIFGVPRQELLAPLDSYLERFDLRTPEGTRPVPVGLLALGGEAVAPVLRKIRTPSGEEKILRTSAAPLRNDRGEVIAAVVVLGDVTAEKADEARARAQAEALRESEEHLRLAKEAAGLGSWDWNVTTGELAWSERCKEMFGLDPHAPVSYEKFLAAVHPEHRPRVEAAVLEALRHGADFDLEMRVTWPDGTDHWISSKGRVFFERGRPVRMAGMTLDVTERRQAEEALREADRRKTEFLGVLSHELRNPLGPILDSVHVLERVPGDGPRAARARDVVRRQTEQLSRLVDDLLDVTRISHGKIQLERAVLDLRDVVRRTCEDHRGLFEQSELELRVGLPAAPVWADVDAARLAQVIGNLLQNASKFTPPHGVVTVTLAAREGRARISVRDTGIGIEPGQLALMFEPFSQEERGRARTRGGLGLGLPLAKGLVELHGGTIEARSEGPGRGSELEVILPLEAAAPATSAPAAASAHGAAAGRLVLIIEDNLDAAQSLADLLELEGHLARVARDAATGIRMARELKPDVVLCDLGLPDMDGYEVARILRRDGSLRSTRLVALSGYAQPEDKERAREAGFDAHLSKPAALEELEAALA